LLHLFLHLRRIEISTTGSTKTATSARPAEATTWPAGPTGPSRATTVVLRKNIADAQSQSGSHRAQGYYSI
jgi:hypothetical protein